MTLDPTADASSHDDDFERTRAPRVLVADDDADIRAEVASGLEEAGFLVVEAADGNELLDLVVRGVADASAHPYYDAIITDVMMPGFSGLDVLTAMRARVARVPVLVITAFADARTSRLAQSLGAASVIRKPFELDKLKAALEDALSIARSARPADAVR
jgi:two-component system, response regulator, stage 0 sporulation protein F